MGWQKQLSQATSAFRDAEFHLGRAEDLLATQAAAVPTADAGIDAQARLAAKLHQAAAAAAPGFLSANLQQLPAQTPPRTDPPHGTVQIRLGTGRIRSDATFPVILPLFGAGHIVIDGDASDERVAGVLQSILLRCLASVPRLTVSLVDCVTLGQTFTGCAKLVDAGIASRTATDGTGLLEALDRAEAHVAEAHKARNSGGGAEDVPYHLVMIAGLPPQLNGVVKSRIAALAHAGPHGRTHLVLAGWRDEGRGHTPQPAIDHGQYITMDTTPDGHTVHDVPVPVEFDAAPPPHLTRTVYSGLADKHVAESKIGIGALLPAHHWTESSVTELSTVIGRDARGDVTLSFGDATPHWLIGGRTGGGKTVFLLDVLYGLASRYGPRELALYLLDFKEGVSFTEFTPSPRDHTWIPHVRAVGVESDREYGTAVLVELRAELTRRATAMKRAGVTKLADLRRAEPELSLPRVLAVIDEFHVLFAGNDRLARRAAAHLEELARKGRSYGIHLILASQTIAGVEALYNKTDSIFGQFPLRVALPGARHVLDQLNTAAESIRLGEAVINDSGGVIGADRVIHFPDSTADPQLLSELRGELWRRREPDAPAPKVFAGYAQQHLDDDPTFAALTADARHPAALVGRAVDVDISTVALTMDSVPGRHLAVLGTSEVGADVLQTAALSLAKQYSPGRVRFHLVPLVAQADAAVDETNSGLRESGHDVTVVPAAGLAELVTRLADPEPNGPTEYLVLYGADSAGPVLQPAGLAKLRTVLKQGPGKGIHVLGWWRGLRRFIDDIGGSNSREDVACLVVLNIPGGEIGPFIGDFGNGYEPRDNRALVIDRHANTTKLCVPFVRSGRDFDEAIPA